MDPTNQILMANPTVILQLNGNNEEPRAISQDGARLLYHFPYGVVAEGLRQVRGAAIEWQWSLRNEDNEPTPRISGFRPFVLRLACRGHWAPRLYRSRGVLDDACFPPESWTLWEKSIISEGLPNPWVARSGNGRSANHDLPFFVIEDTKRNGGLFLVLGWSGDWDLRMERHVEQVLIHAGMTPLNLTLMPGEQVRQPSLLLGAYQGAAVEGFRAIRNTLRDEIQPRHRGKRIPLITCFNNYYGDLTFIGGQHHTYEGISGLAGLDPVSGKRAVVIFGACLQEVTSSLPEGFTSLADTGPRWGDLGNEQFSPGYLFYGL